MSYEVIAAQLREKNKVYKKQLKEQQKKLMVLRVELENAYHYSIAAKNQYWDLHEKIKKLTFWQRLKFLFKGRL
jgi:hypothetical protein